MTYRIMMTVNKLRIVIVAVLASICVVGCKTSFNKDDWTHKFMVDSRSPTDLHYSQSTGGLLVIQWEEYGSFLVYVAATSTLTTNVTGRDVEIKLYVSIPKRGSVEDTWTRNIRRIDNHYDFTLKVDGFDASKDKLFIIDQEGRHPIPFKGAFEGSVSEIPIVPFSAGGGL